MNDITMQLSFCSGVLLSFPGLQHWFSTDYVVIAHFLICQEANGVGRGGGGGGGGTLEASENHNVSNVKIDTYVITSRLWLIHLNMIWYLDDMAVLFDQAVNDSQSLTYIAENFLGM